MPTYASQRLDTVALDFAFRDRPCLADHAGAKASGVDLRPQCGRRHPESGCRLGECQHLEYEMVERVSPGPYLELFARRRRYGWDVWGNEAPEEAASQAEMGLVA